MAHEYRDLPDQQDYKYTPRAGDPDAKNPPLSKHLFEAMYYTCPTPCTKWVPHNCSSPPNTGTIVTRFPKRAKEFHRDQTSPIWGLEAVFSVSAARIVIYHLIIVAGPFVFFGLWLGARGSPRGFTERECSCHYSRGSIVTVVDAPRHPYEWKRVNETASSLSYEANRYIYNL
jgi:hypothetical protein